MAEKQPQTFANHAQWDPPFHFVVLPILLLTFLWSIAHCIRHFRPQSAGFIVVMIAVIIAAFKIRLYSLKVQDRLIRLEERLRLSTLLSEPLRSRIPELSEDQLCGLRFASDGEVAKLAERAMNEKLSRKDIKQAIQNWRPDYWRV